MKKLVTLILVILTFIFFGGCRAKTPPTIEKGKIVFIRFKPAAFTEEDKTEIFTIKPNGQDEERITKNARMELFPSWSQDGKKILCAIDELGTEIVTNKEEIILIDSSTKKEKSLSINSGAPNFSPNGKKIVFIRDGNLWIMDDDGDNQKKITKFSEDSSLGNACWSTDGKTLIFAYKTDDKNKTGFDIFRISISGTSLQRLTKGKENEIDPAISPDGQTIIFSKEKKSGYELVMMKPNGKDQKIFLPVKDGGIQTTWAPDGKMLAFVKDESIFLISLNKKYKTKLTDGLYPDWIF